MQFFGPPGIVKVISTNSALDVDFIDIFFININIVNINTTFSKFAKSIFKNVFLFENISEKGDFNVPRTISYLQSVLFIKTNCKKIFKCGLTN